ncbi:MAG: single-stranded DNA-binding protein [Planctomycetota bacterium]
MASSFNQVTLVGNLTRDVELKYLSSGTAVADLSLAVNERRKHGSDWVDDVHYFDCTAFARTAEVAGEYLNKGSSVLVSGRLRQERWEKDGQKRSKVSVTVDRLVMLGGKSEVDRTENQPMPSGVSRDDVVAEDTPF